MKKYPFYSVTRLLKAFGYSFEGLVAALKTEAAFKLELFCLIFLLPIAMLTDCSVVEKVLLVSSLILVVMAELMNTAIEAVVDRISEEKHDLSKKAKDVGSAIVLVSLINAVFTWGIILFMG